MKDVNEPKKLAAFLLSLGYDYGTDKNSLISLFYDIETNKNAVRVEIFLDYIDGNITSKTTNFGHKVLVGDRWYEKYFEDGGHLNSFITERVILSFKKKLIEKITKNIIKTLVP